MKPNTQPETKEEIELNKNKLKSNKGPYILGEKLGEGAFAKVRLATQIHIKEKCAVKILEKKLLESSRDIQRLKKEIKILKKLRHKNIIQLYDIMESKRNLYFVMEYCKNGELFDYIVSKKRLKEQEACRFFQQIINGVEYLHNQGIIHRDLKPENLLLDDKFQIKISDFGLSTFFSKNNYLQTACGTPSYAPPEMLEGHEYNGEATDVWSCGIILYAMLCGTLPFSESQEEIIVKKIKSHDYVIPNYLSKDAKDLLNHILIINPKERYNIKQIQGHPWFNLIKPHMVPGINLEEDIIPVDDKILEMVKNYGFDPVECKELLLKNKFCSLTTIYYLCLKKYINENGKSISDLESDLFEKYIKDPKNKIKKEKNKEETKEENKELKKEEKESNNNEINSTKTESDKSRVYNIRLPTKKINLNKNEKNTIMHNDKIKGSPTLNYIKISNDKRNLASSKSIKKKGHKKIEENNHIKLKLNYENKTENQTKENNNKNEINRVLNRNINKNKSPVKTSKTICINKQTLIKNKPNENERIKNTSIRKNKIKLINTNDKTKKSIDTDKKLIISTERKSLTSKFNLNEESITKEPTNKPINTNVNIINININSNQIPSNFNITEKNQDIIPNNMNVSGINNISDKELPYLLKQKLNDISQKNENKNNDLNNNNINIRDDEEEIKALLNSINFKEINNQSDTYSNIYNNNSHLFSSVFQDSVMNSQTKTFIDIPKNYSLKKENMVNNNSSRPKSSLYQYLGNDFEKYMLMKGERPINVINYIAQKLVATSFCGSFNYQNGFNNGSYIFNNSMNQMASFLKKKNEDSRKSNGNGENKNENSFENNNSNIKDTSLFVNDDNDDKDLNFKNLVSILNKKFKSYLSKEKFNKSEIVNKNNKPMHKKSNDYNNNINLNMNKINNIKISEDNEDNVSDNEIENLKNKIDELENIITKFKGGNNNNLNEYGINNGDNRIENINIREAFVNMLNELKEKDKVINELQNKLKDNIMNENNNYDYINSKINTIEQNQNK